MYFNNCEIFKKEVTNSKENIFYIHGFNSSFQKRTFISNLLPNFNFYSINLPGHGNSTFDENKISIKKYIEILVEYIESLNLKKITLYGHSMGGGLSLILSNMLNIKIEKMILESPINTSTIQKIKNISDFFESKKESIQKISKILFSQNNLISKTSLSSALSKIQTNRKNNKQIFNIWKNSELKIWDEKISNAIKQNKIETLVILGKQDLIIPYKKSLENFSSNNYFKTISLNNCGHNPALEKSFSFISEVKNFIE
ncbi:MAG: alpha/beta hydrolase [Mycoplasma sp.]|nr:alpha/beta hydrolase [Mycoplasma sp.]